MAIELTLEQHQALGHDQTRPIEVIDPVSGIPYVLVAREQFDKLHYSPENNTELKSWCIPEGIRRSQEALRKALPALLSQPKLSRCWVAYHGSECIGVSADGPSLREECFRRGLPDDQYYIGLIDPSELIEVEEIELRPQHFEGDEPIDET